MAIIREETESGMLLRILLMFLIILECRRVEHCTLQRSLMLPQTALCFSSPFSLEPKELLVDADRRKGYSEDK